MLPYRALDSILDDEMKIKAWFEIKQSLTDSLFPMNFAMATLGLKELGKFFWEGREKKFAQLAVSV